MVKKLPKQLTNRLLCLFACSALNGLLPASALAAGPNEDTQETAWRAALEANVTAGYQAYLSEYPRGRYAPR